MLVKHAVAQVGGLTFGKEKKRHAGDVTDHTHLT